MSERFSKNFLWGASSSAFQIEGAWDEDGKGMTVADYNSFKRSKKQADSKVASDFYHHWKDCIDEGIRNADVSLFFVVGKNYSRWRWRGKPGGN